MTYNEYGHNNVLQVRDVAQPKVGPGEVRIRVAYASVNPVDWKVMSGALDPMMDANFPVIPGWDVSGVVAETGPDVPEFAPGDRVASYARKSVVSAGTFAEYVTVPADHVAAVPENVSDQQAAALPLTGLTARRAIRALNLNESDTVLLHAASGGVGFLASQLAVATGATVIGTASPSNFDKLKKAGVMPVEYGDGLEERIKHIAPDGVTAVADFAGDVLDVTLDVLTDEGHHVSIADPGVLERGGQWLWVRPDGAGLAELLALLSDGKLTLDIDRTLPLSDVPEAFRLSQEGQVNGKILIDVAD